MKIIPIVIENVAGVDEAGNPVITAVARPAEPFPSAAVKVVAGADGYTVYEEGDVVP